MKEKKTAMFNLKKVILALAVCSLTGMGTACSETITHTVKPGFDWTLPVTVKPSEYSGAFYMGRGPDFPDVTMIGRVYTWSELNPREDVYDFSRIRELLKNAESDGSRVVLRLFCLTTSHSSPVAGIKKTPFVPQWVMKKHKPEEFYTYRGAGLKRFQTGKSKNYYIKVAAPWNKGLQAELAGFIEQFAKQGFFEHESLTGIYIHGFSTSFGEEFWLDESCLQSAKAAGMTEESLMKAFEDRIDRWVSAAGENVHKLVWINFGGINGSGYDQDRLNDYALKKGLGLRDGGLEYYHRYIPPAYGQTYSDGYVSVDWSHPLRSTNRYFGEELECTARKFVKSGIPARQQTHLSESSLMRAAQLGMKYLWTSREFINTAPEMFRWWTLIAGKGPKESPDAVCWLREDYFWKGKRTISWKNFERLLYQRDFADAGTRPAVKIERPAVSSDPAGIHYDYGARATDVDNGFDKMLFFLEKEFKEALNSDLFIKVTFYDDSAAKWVLEVPSPTGRASSDIVGNVNDKNWKTVTFHLRKPAENKYLEHNADFSLRVVSGGDLTVKFVRVVKQD